MKNESEDSLNPLNSADVRYPGSTSLAQRGLPKPYQQARRTDKSARSVGRRSGFGNGACAEMVADWTFGTAALLPEARSHRGPRLKGVSVFNVQSTISSVTLICGLVLATPS